MPESPKWLYKKGKYAECFEVIQRMAKFNGKQISSARLLILNQSETQQSGHINPTLPTESGITTGMNSPAVPKKQMSIKEEILSNKSYIINIVSMCLVWCSASFGYYLIGYDLKYIKGDKYINGIISSSSECVAFVTAGILIDKVGIKPTLIFSYVVAIAGMLSLVLVDTQS